MNFAEATTLAFSVHGAVLLVAATTYFKYANPKELFDKLPEEIRRLRQSIRNRITSEIADQLRPIVRDSTSVRTGLFRPEGDYFEKPADVTEGEGYYQAVHDFVTNSSTALVDYSLVIGTAKAWRDWAHRLSSSILFLVILESFMLASTLLVLVSINETLQVPLWALLVGSVPTAIVMSGVFTCLIYVHRKQGVIVDLKENYDTSS